MSKIWLAIALGASLAAWPQPSLGSGQPVISLVLKNAPASYDVWTGPIADRHSAALELLGKGTSSPWERLSPRGETLVLPAKARSLRVARNGLAFDLELAKSRDLPGPQRVVDLGGLPAPKTLDLVVTTANGTPVRAARVVLLSSRLGSGPWQVAARAALSDENGKVSLPTFEGEVLRLGILAPGFELLRQSFIPGNTTVHFSLVKAAGASLTVYEEPTLAAADVLVCTKDGYPLGVTDKLGRVELPLSRAEDLILSLAPDLTWEIAAASWRQRDFESFVGGGGLIEGRVEDGEQIGLPGATISLKLEGSEAFPANKGIALADGSFFVSHLDPGHYLLEVGAVGHVTSEQWVHIVPGRNTLAPIRLRRGGSIRGNVAAPEGGPAVGTRIYAWSTPARRAQSLTSELPRNAPVAVADEQGNFETLPLPAERVDLEFRKKGIPPLLLKEIPVDGPPLEILLEAAATLELEVEGPDGNPVEAALVRLRTGDAARLIEFDHELFTDNDGKAKLAELPAGDAVLHVESSYLAWEEKVALEAGKTLHVQVRLLEGAVFSGKVYTREGLPVAGARVELLASGSQHDVVAGSTTDELGEFRITGLPAGEQLFRVRHSHYGEVTESVFLPTSGQLRREFRFGGGNRIQGRVVDTEGRPVEGAEVHLFEQMQTAQISTGLVARSDAAGEFTFEGIPPKNFLLQVQKAGRVMGSARIDVRERDHRVEILVGERSP